MMDGKYWANNSTYNIDCKICQQTGNRSTYIGETRNVYDRMKQHTSALRNRKEKSVLYNHIKEVHRDIDTKTDFNNFEFIPGRTFKTPLIRQACEGAELLHILSKNKDNQMKGKSPTLLLNSKLEFHAPCGLLTTKTLKFFE